MKQLVIIPGGFHPFHAGHMSLYNAAKQVFPQADVYVAATDDTSVRPFPFAIKEKLAKLAGVDPEHFVQVKSPFRAQEITSKYDPETTQLIFVRSSKDKDKPPQPGGNKKDGTPSYLQPIIAANKKPQPMNKHGYMAYLPTIEFASGLTSASEIRGSWPHLESPAKIKLVNTIYPRTKGNNKLTDNVIQMLDLAIQSQNQVEEGFYSDAEADERFQQALKSLEQRVKDIRRKGRLVSRLDPESGITRNVHVSSLSTTDPDYEEEKKS